MYYVMYLVSLPIELLNLNYVSLCLNRKVIILNIIITITIYLSSAKFPNTHSCLDAYTKRFWMILQVHLIYDIICFHGFRERSNTRRCITQQ